MGAVAVVLACGIAGKDLILERWWLHRFESWNEEVSREAAERLGAIRSRRAIPLLVEALGSPRIDHGIVAKTILQIGAPAVAEALAAYGESFIVLLCRANLETAAVPLLLDCLDDPRLDVRLWSVYGLSKPITPSIDRDPLPSSNVIRPILLEALRSDNPEYRRTAVTCLRFAADRGRRFALPALAEALTDTARQVREAAVHSLARIPDPRVIPILGKALEDRDPALRSLAMETLYECKGIGGPAEWGVAVGGIMIAMEASETAWWRSRAIELLGTAGPVARRAVPLLVKLVENGEVRTSLAAIDALRAIGPDAAEAVHAVIGRIAEPEIEGGAIEMLIALGPAAAGAVPNLVGLLRAGKPPPPVEIFRILGSIGSAASDAFPAVLSILDDTVADPQVCVSAAVALGRIAPGDPRSLAALKRVAEEMGQLPYGEDLSFIGPLALSQPEGVLILEKALAEGRFDIRFGAIQALGEAGPTARSALPVLDRLLREEGSILRIEAARAIWLVSGDASDILPILVDALDGERTVPTLSEVATALGELGTAAAPAVPDLVKVLKGIPRSEGTRAVIVAIGSIGPHANAAVPVLIKKLAVSGLCVAAAHALAKIGPAAVPALTEALSSGNDWTRYGAARALAALGPDARVALSALEAARNDDDEDVRALVTEAVKAIRAGGR